MQLNSLFKDVQAYPWLAFLFVTVGAVVVALIAYATIYAVLRRFTRANSTAVVIVNYTAQPAKLALPLLALKLTLPEMLAGLPDGGRN
jgi:hypothetical protein